MATLLGQANQLIESLALMDKTLYEKDFGRLFTFDNKVDKLAKALEDTKFLPYIILHIFSQASELFRYLDFSACSGTMQVFKGMELSEVTPNNLNMEVTKAKEYCTEDVIVPLYDVGKDIDIPTNIIGRGTSAAGKESFYNSLASYFYMYIKAYASNIAKMLIVEDENSDLIYKDKSLIHSKCKKEQIISNNDSPLKLENLDKLILMVNEPTHLMMNKIMKDHFKKYHEDNPDNEDVQVDKYHDVISYKGLPIIGIGVDENYNEILPFSELQNNSKYPSRRCTSVYCLSLYHEGGIFGIQDGILRSEFLGAIEAFPVYRIRLSWNIGLVVRSPFAIARLAHITDGLIVK